MTMPVELPPISVFRTGSCFPAMLLMVCSRPHLICALFKIHQISNVAFSHKVLLKSSFHAYARTNTRTRTHTHARAQTWPVLDSKVLNSLILVGVEMLLFLQQHKFTFLFMKYETQGK